jgi:hypothetical protein
MTIGDSQASAEDSDHVDFVPPVLPALAVLAIIHERADFTVCISGLAAWHGVDEHARGFADKDSERRTTSTAGTITIILHMD